MLRFEGGQSMGEAMRSMAVIGVFIGLAVGWAGAERWVRGHAVQVDSGRGDPSRAPYSSGAVAPEPKRSLQPSIWLVDGFNLLHAAVLRSGDSREGWWKGPNRDRVVELARAFDDADAEVVIVFDGSEEPTVPVEGGPKVVFAASADEWLLAAVRMAPEPGRVAVVTADRRLRDRLRDRGAQVVSPSAFAARCRGVEMRPEETSL
jgi:predicted RNA-binding protein with PIN domain